MDQLLRFHPEKAKEEKDGLAQHIANPNGYGKGQGEGKPGLQTPLAASSPSGATEKPQLPAPYLHYAENVNGAADRKKASLNEAQKHEPGTTPLAKDREREALRSGAKQQLAPEQPAEQRQFAYRREAVPQTRALGLSRGFQSGFGGAAPAVGPRKEQTGAPGGRVGGVPNGPLYSLTDKTVGANAAKAAVQSQKPPTSSPRARLIVREYAHLRPASGPSTGRSDFDDTLYWHPVLVLPNGKAEVCFNLGDAAASYEITAVGHTIDGRLGAVTLTLESRLP
jgi:hypothetical protein